MEEAENLVRNEDSENESVSVTGPDEEDQVSVSAGLTLFDDPPRTGVIYEGPANFEPPVNNSLNPFVIPPEVTANELPPVAESKEDIEFKLLCKRVELRKLEFEENERVRRHELEMANLKLEMARLTNRDDFSSSPNPALQGKFNLSVALKLVPVFDEASVPDFFKAFERVASRLSWPSEMWTVLIQCRLVGKAVRVYNALDETVAKDYQKVKSLVLKAYDLVPEAYRLKFRNSVKTPSLSYVEFARMKEEQLDDWLKSRQVVSLAALRELFLLEEFKKFCSKELRVYLEEVKASSLSRAAQIADEFVLTHKSESGDFNHRPRANPSSRSNMNFSSPVSLMVDNGASTPVSNSGSRPVEKSSVSSSNSSSVGPHVKSDGAARSLVLKEALRDLVPYSGNYIVLGGFPDTVVSAPLVEVRLSFPGYDNVTELAVVGSLPVPGIDGILGNDMLDAKGCEIFPILSVHACPVAAVTTRAAAKAADLITDDDDLMLGSLEVDVERPGSVVSSSGSSNDLLKPGWDRLAFIRAQKEEFNFELGDLSDLTKPKFGILNGVLYRFSRLPTEDLGQTFRIEQIVVPTPFHDYVLKLAHHNSFSGHFGVWKTFQNLAKGFWWPGMKSSVKLFVKQCEACQVMGKPNQPIPKAPLHPIPAIGEPFAELVVDVVGPLPKTKTGYGLPRVIQTDCGTNFTSKVFRGKCDELAIHHTTSVPYHPESQGVVERFHQTLKSILKKHCYEQGDEWDKALPFALFALHSHSNASTGVAPFELVFGHKVRGPLEIFGELLETGQKGDLPIGEFMESLKNRLSSAWAFAQENLKCSQALMKYNFDKKTKVRSFEPGEMVLVLSMDPDNFLEPRYKGPWKVLRKLSEVNYEIEAPGTRRKCRVFHINRLRAYHCKDLNPLAIVYESVAEAVELPLEDSEDILCQVPSDALFGNLQNLEVLREGLDHLDLDQKNDILNLIASFPDLFQDSPGRTHFLQHDVDVGNASPVKQSPYRLNPVKREIVEEEIKYMLDHDLIQPSVSPWSSPIVLVKKADGKFRMCVDYRKVNAHTKNDSFPLPRIDDCLDQIGSAKFITKLDLLKGYWQVPLSDRAREISAFVTPFGLYECKVMPFGMKNAACTFQRLMNRVICGLEGTEIYIDDLVVYSNDWQTHIFRLRKVFEALRAAGLVINLGKCEFGKAKVVYLGHEVGLGQVAPRQANLEAIINLKQPSNIREVRRVLVDASDVGIGGVLFQRGEDGEVWTDHNPLVFIERMKGANQRILRWALQLQEFTLEIKHVKGTENKLPDALSRA
ncbi:uncharacterized protein [Macrobrachium rosenbergii]|uniref:uncharacterized protein n=1 Tax=Macrobrachium rosenbergii TaxID=79674 RepID=UPI0034D4E83E